LLVGSQDSVQYNFLFEQSQNCSIYGLKTFRLSDGETCVVTSGSISD